MNNLKQQIKQISDTKQLYNIIDNFYRKNNILHIRIKTKYNYFIFNSQKLYMYKFNKLLPYIYNNDEYYKEWVKYYSKEFKHCQTLYFFNQITNE